MEVSRDRLCHQGVDSDVNRTTTDNQPDKQQQGHQ